MKGYIFARCILHFRELPAGGTGVCLLSQPAACCREQRRLVCAHRHTHTHTHAGARTGKALPLPDSKRAAVGGCSRKCKHRTVVSARSSLPGFSTACCAHEAILSSECWLPANSWQRCCTRLLLTLDAPDPGRSREPPPTFWWTHLLRTSSCLHPPLCLWSVFISPSSQFKYQTSVKYTAGWGREDTEADFSPLYLICEQRGSL